MEVLINELSLDGQFNNENEFFDNFDHVLEVIKLLEVLHFSILKEYMLFNAPITHNYRFNDFLTLRNDRARKMKRVLSKLSQNPPYWNETQKHNCDKNNYLYQSQDICNTSLAESCERDKMVVSFKHSNFLSTTCNVTTNNSTISIYNIINKIDFLFYLIENNQITPIEYCISRFNTNKLNFNNIEQGYGFDLLETTQQVKEFIEAFELFYKTPWNNIVTSDGLEYKPYKPSSKKKNWFRNSDFSTHDIDKFRVTQKYRCFGYRQQDTFYVLRFEIDHKISDNG